MNTLLAISGPGVIGNLIWLIVLGIIFWLIWWLIDYVKIPEPFNKVARVLIAVAAVVVIINVLLSFVDRSFIRF